MSLGLQLIALRASVERVLVSEKPNAVSQFLPTSRVKRIIEMAFDIARREGSSVVDTGHLLLAIVEEGNGIAAHVLRDNGVTDERAGAALAGLRQAGQADAGRIGQALTRVYRRRHLDIKDEEGRTVAIDILFPAEYSEEQCSALTARVKKAVSSHAE